MAAPGRRPGGHAEQVGPIGRSPIGGTAGQLGGGAAAPDQRGEPRRVLFVTGKLAAPALRDTLDRTELPFDYEIAVMKITVAALMTTDWIARFLEPPEAVTKIMIPGLCEGDTEVLAERFGPRTGPWLASLGRGEGSARVYPEGWTRKGLSKEHTFQRDLTDPAEIRTEVARIAREVAVEQLTEAVAAGIASGGPNLVVVKATYDPPPNTSPNWYRVVR